MNVQNHEHQEYTTLKRNNAAKAKRTRLDNVALYDALDILEAIEGALKDVLSDTDSFAGACRKRGLHQVNIKKLLISKSFSSCRIEKVPLRLEELAALEPDGYEQLYIDVFGTENICNADLPLDFRQTALDVVETLNRQEQNVLRLRYGFRDKYDFPMTLEKAGSELGVTAPRVKAIQDSALSKLRHPPLKTWLMEGTIKYQARQKICQSDLDTYKAAVYSQLNSYLVKMDQNMRQESNTEKEKYLSLEIDTLGFSNRTSNCLKRAGKTTFLDVLELTDEDMSKIRGLGKKCREEIYQKRMKLMPDVIKNQEQIQGVVKDEKS